MRALSAAADLSHGASSELQSQVREADALAINIELDGRYRILRKLGRGGMGQVYEAEHIKLARRVAIKVLRANIGSTLEVRNRFEREAQAIAQVESEHIVGVFDFGVAPSNQLYLVLEYLVGRDLRSILDEEGSLAAPRATRLLHDACLGLSAAHARGVIHRDLKPENLFVVRRGDDTELCKVLDFGLAKLKTSSAPDAQTKAGIPFGTLHYMSPEQARGDSDIDERTDVYGCCAVLYEMLTGLRPHVADSTHALLYKIIHETPRRADQIAGAFMPSALADLVERGLASNRAQRFSSMRALTVALEPFIGPRGLASLEVGPLQPDAVNSTAQTQSAAPCGPAPATAPVPGTIRRLAPLFGSAVVGGLLAWLVGSGHLANGPATEARTSSLVAPSPTPTSVTATAALPPAAPPPQAPNKAPPREANGAGDRERRAVSRPAPSTVGPVASSASPALAPSSPAPAIAHDFERRNPYQ